jgi:hypothetical protein
VLFRSDAGQSICCGLNVFQSDVAAGQSFVDSNWGTLSACQGGLKEADRGWAAYFVAASLYHGDDIRTHLSAFVSARDHDGNCKGEQNFIAYIRSLKDAQGNPLYTYAANVTSIFRDAVDECDSECQK